MSDEQPLPANDQAERAVLGALLMGIGGAYDRVAPIVGEEDFRTPEHRLIFHAIASMEGKGVDILTVKDTLAAMGKIAAVGGGAYVSSLTDGIPDVANVERYARIVVETANRRRAIHECNRLKAAAYSGEPISEIAANGAMLFSDIAAARDAGPRAIADISRASFTRLEKRMAGGNALTGITTGLPKVDSFTLGLPRGVESLLGARPRVGKTAVAIAICFAVLAAEQRAMYFQLDMSAAMMGDRMLAAMAAVSSFKVRSGQYLTAGEIAKLAKADAKMRSYRDRLILDHTTRDIAKMAAIVRREARASGLDLVVVDHIGHVRGGKGEKRYLEVGDVSSRLIELAGETNAAVMALVQLGRDAEGRKPDLADLRESGNLEQDARLVLMLYRPALWNEDGAKQCLLRAYVPKNEGETGIDIDAHFNVSTQRVTQDREHGCPYCQADVPSGNELFV